MYCIPNIAINALGKNQGASNHLLIKITGSMSSTK